VDKQRILIVEDDLDLAEMLDAYFRVQNYEVVTAAWGEEAIRISTEEVVNLIVLDIRLPDINGYEVVRQLRSQRRTQDVPIIFLTEKRDRVDKLQGLELGVVDYITKPFDIQELRLRVRNAITRAERAAMINPVTDLPELSQTEEKITGLLYSDLHWAVLYLAIAGLEQVRDVYGFVAADEVLRAVTLMVRNAVREYGSEEDYIGHLTPEGLAIITNAERVSSIRDRIENRIRPSLHHFYPPKARETSSADYLQLTSRIVDYTNGPFKELDEVKAKLLDEPADKQPPTEKPPTEKPPTT
jgi:PleD family two-component response regulator